MKKSKIATYSKVNLCYLELRTMRRLAALLAIAVAAGLFVFALSRGGAGLADLRTAAPQPPGAAFPVAVEPSKRLVVQVLSVRPHDPTGFTQGLLLRDGLLYESTGLVGQSSLREVDPHTGGVLRRFTVDPPIFAEGLALVDDRLIQLTWQNGLALVYDLPSFERIGEFRYQGEGWGLCYDGQRLVMSDGSSQLFFRDPLSFDLLGQVTVTRDGLAMTRLNELECVGDHVYANVWQTDEILDIERDSGTVFATIDASGLLSADELRARQPDDVLNGIAFDSDSGNFLITGKRWAKLLEVRFVPS
jgi:glutaminyl-peptide cyclotransferase